MKATADSIAGIDREYAARNPRSRELFERQRMATPGGYTHWARQLDPFPLFIAESHGVRKRDVDGHDYVDYWLGHGALLLGHGHSAVLKAVEQQAERGFHAGGETELGLEWAELVRSMVPSAETVRFTSSGGEATQMALRVARAYTGKDRVLKFEYAFHGWHDSVTIAVLSPLDVPFSTGVPKAIAENTITAPLNDIRAVEMALESHLDVAAVIIEPGGTFDDTVLSDPQFLIDLRKLCTERGVLLIFDEVVTGFRYARGGAQEFFGVTPDLTALGKVIGGGLPAGALAGRADVMDVLAWRPNDEHWSRFKMVPHPGTWNAMPIVAAAGVATLSLIRDEDHIERAKQAAQKLVEGINAVYDELGIAGFAYGRTSIFKMCRGEPPPMVFGDFSNAQADAQQLLTGWGPIWPAMHKAALLEGIDFMRVGGFTSSAHTDADIEETCGGLERALRRLQRDEIL
jgi:glutamate-1-semialdehyde 2,1-aminomutase